MALRSTELENALRPIGFSYRHDVGAYTESQDAYWLRTTYAHQQGHWVLYVLEWNPVTNQHVHAGEVVLHEGRCADDIRAFFLALGYAPVVRDHRLKILNALFFD